MEEYAGRILANRYRLPLPPSDAYELVETRAFDTRSGQEVLVHVYKRQPRSRTIPGWTRSSTCSPRASRCG